ncbi:MAG: SH3 domain-containing protein [Lachnospiraceae bacterium]|nr:SH3 domain-containing protein [Lachnospiraceae bacterium]
MKKMQWKLLFLLAVCVSMLTFAVPAHAALSKGSEGVTTSVLNMRASASTSGKLITSIPKGRTVLISGVNSAKTWYAVKYNGKAGYVSASYVTSISNAKEQGIIKTRVMAVSLRMKKSASDSASNITAINSGKGYLPVNKTVVLLGSANSKYYAISSYGYVGYVSKGYFTNEVTYKTVKKGGVNFRQSASVKSKKLAFLKSGTKVVVLGQSGSFWKCYAKVGTGYRIGYIANGYFTGQQTMKTTDNLRLRKAANTTSSVLLIIPKGASVTVLKKTTSTWYYVNYNGTKGYVMAKYLK